MPETLPENEVHFEVSWVVFMLRVEMLPPCVARLEAVTAPLHLVCVEPEIDAPLTAKEKPDSIMKRRNAAKNLFIRTARAA